MFRTIRLAFMLAAVLTAAGEARAQYGYGGYGGYGWGGWGSASTPGSSLARGLGMLSMGAGMYNMDTAQANSINMNTAMRWNQAMYDAHIRASKMLAAREKKLPGILIQDLLRDPGSGPQQPHQPGHHRRRRAECFARRIDQSGDCRVVRSSRSRRRCGPRRSPTSPSSSPPRG